MYWVIILIILIIFAYLAWRKSLWGIYAVIFSLPLYLWKFNLAGIPFTVVEMMIYILAFIFFLKKGQEKKSLFIKEIKNFVVNNLSFNPLLAIGIILLFSGAIIATIISSDIRVSAGILKGWFFAPVIFFLLFISAIKKADEARRALSVLAFSGALVALAAFIYLFVPEYAGVTYDERLRAFYLSANHLAMYLAPALIILGGLCIWRISSSKSAFCVQCMFTYISHKASVFPRPALKCASPKSKFIINNAIYYLILAMVGFIFYHTYSYGAWLGVLAALIFILGANYRLENKKKSSFIYTAVLLVVLAGIMFSRANPDKFKNIVNFTYPSVSSRAIIWEVAGDILEEHWLVGVGPGTFQEHYLKKQAEYSPYPEWAVPQPHNIFLAFWLQTGLLGLIGFLMILVWFFKAGFGILKNKNQEDSVIASLRHLAETKQSRGINSAKCLAVICLAIMLYTLIHGLIDTTYWKNDLALIFWLLIGVMYAVKNKNGDFDH